MRRGTFPVTTRQIKALRRQLDMTLEEFARTVGVSLQTAWRWEQGTKPLPLCQQALQKLADKSS